MRAKCTDRSRQEYGREVATGGDQLEPTIGLVLVTDKDDSIVKYSVLADNENLFASKYRLYLPTEEELKAELHRERELLERQIKEHGGGAE